MFSVVIPLYNKELSITNTVQSVLDQTYQNFEIVIVNDGSTDSSIKAVEAINDNRIRLIHQENQGVSAARNRGIKEAKYEWIAFLDGDDLWEVNHLEEINKMMNIFPKEKVYVTSFAYSDGRVMFKHPRPKPIFKIENYFKEVIKENLISSSNVVVHKSCIDQVGGFNTSLAIGEDLELWARFAREQRIIKTTSVTATYRVEAENRTGLSKKIEKSHVYHFDLSTMPSSDEKHYYQQLILARLYEFLRAMDFTSFLKLKSRHSEVGYTEVALYVLRHLKGRLQKKVFNFRS